jgi:OHCU decarboxylase
MSPAELLNSLSAEQAEAELLKCCGSTRWARQLLEQRPFADVSDLLRKADETWWSLGPDDWLEAFRSHPQIGGKKAEQAQSSTAKTWSEQEQSGTRDSAQETMAALAGGNRAYSDRFGYIFIVCATGKSAEEMLSNLNSRLDNDPETELKIAAEEQRKITNIRLNKLIA